VLDCLLVLLDNSTTAQVGQDRPTLPKYAASYATLKTLGGF